MVAVERFGNISSRGNIGQYRPGTGVVVNAVAPDRFESLVER